MRKITRQADHHPDQAKNLDRKWTSLINGPTSFI